MVNKVKGLFDKLSRRQINSGQLREEVEKIIASDLSKVHPKDMENLAELGGMQVFSEILLANKDYQENRLILNEFEAVRNGDYFPTTDPYTREEDLRKLQGGVERGLYTSKQLNSVLKNMEESESYRRLLQIGERRWTVDHTPFASTEENLNDYGFHVFIGKERFGDGRENLVTLDSLAATSYGGVEQSIENLIDAIKKNRRVLLTKSPGKSDTGSLAPRLYLPLDGEQSFLLKEGYENWTEKDLYENPFNYQPE